MTPGTRLWQPWTATLPCATCTLARTALPTRPTTWEPFCARPHRNCEAWKVSPLARARTTIPRPSTELPWRLWSRRLLNYRFCAWNAISWCDHWTKPAQWHAAWIIIQVSNASPCPVCIRRAPNHVRWTRSCSRGGHSQICSRPVKEDCDSPVYQLLDLILTNCKYYWSPMFNLPHLFLSSHRAISLLRIDSPDLVPHVPVLQYPL